MLRQDVFLERLELHDGNFSAFVSLLKRVKRLLQIRFDIGFVVFQLFVRGFVTDKGIDELFLNRQPRRFRFGLHLADLGLRLGDRALILVTERERDGNRYKTCSII